MQGKPKVETILIDSSKPTNSEIEEYRHLVSEMKREIRWMDEKYGEKWENVAKSDYLRLTSLEEKLDKIQAKYPNYNFKNNEMKGNEKMKNENRNQEFLRQLKEEKEINMTDIEVRATGTQYAPVSGNSQVEVPQNLVAGILMEAERSNELFHRVHMIRTSQNTKLNVGAYQQEELAKLEEFEEISMKDFAISHCEVVMNRYGTGSRLSRRLIQASNFDVMQHCCLLFGDRLALTCEKEVVRVLEANNKMKEVAMSESALNDLVKAVLNLKPVDRAQAVVVASPSFFEACVLEQDKNGRNQLSYNLDGIRHAVMGVPVVVSDALESGAYVGNFGRGVVACVNIENIKAVDAPQVHAVDLFLNCYFGVEVQMPEAVVRIKQQ